MEDSGTLAANATRRKEPPLKRSTLVAGILIAGTLGLGALSAPKAWRGIAYRNDTSVAFEVDRRGYIHERELRWKRAEWLPGPDLVLADERCSRCIFGDHSRCAGSISLRWNSIQQAKGHTRAESAQIPAAECTCSCDGRTDD